MWFVNVRIKRRSCPMWWTRGVARIVTDIKKKLRSSEPLYAFPPSALLLTSLTDRAVHQAYLVRRQRCSHFLSTGPSAQSQSLGLLVLRTPRLVKCGATFMTSSAFWVALSLIIAALRIFHISWKPCFRFATFHGKIASNWATLKLYFQTSELFSP